MNVSEFPFPYVCEHDVFDRSLLGACLAEIPWPSDDRWKRYGNAQEVKLEGPEAMWGHATLEYFDDVRALAPLLEEAFDLPDLHMETIGGGYHLIPPGGFLDVHTDFSRSPKTGRYRRVNVLTYLNHFWEWTDGGHLELWSTSGDEKVTWKPDFGTTVAFVTSATSWHGHPVPTKRWRASLAAYFFTDEAPPGFVEQSTVWHPNGGRRA